jgi:hypothetical protein
MTAASGRRALVLADKRQRVERFVPAIERAGFDVRHVERVAEAQRTVLESRIDLLVLALPLRGAERVLAALRLGGSPSRRAGALIVGEGEGREADAVLGRMANRMLPPDCSPAAFERAITTVLRAEPRVELRGEPRARLRLPGSAGAELAIADLSASGMLVRAPVPPPLAAVFAFELELPDDEEPLGGWAQVVRRTPPTASDPAFGARFVGLDAEAAARLRRLVERASASGEHATAGHAGTPARKSGGAASAAPVAGARDASSPAGPVDELLRRVLPRWLGFGTGPLRSAEAGIEPLRSYSPLLDSSDAEAPTPSAARSR